MKYLRERQGVLLSVAAAIAVMVLAGCYEERPYNPGPPPPPPVATEGYDYYYYPDEEVYFYPATGVYFWAGGGGWHSGRHLPPTIVLHDRVNVRLNTRAPYERHEEIRARYPSHAAPHEEHHEEPMEHGH